ncbi:carbohydrate esterase family 3 protein [Ophiocordyceps camponoti-floridani]|uniref:Carbohydrate esterase family 3 protein n=1 Tax=Ophiocordyceps camponoti-floridani TaxID=2030778 RepID=A0A8H4Q6I5_9HYPO|nr:carbohydrate esterase family 3 protein [Ophiocordyceps camponoti-floridani]
MRASLPVAVCCLLGLAAATVERDLMVQARRLVVRADNYSSPVLNPRQTLPTPSNRLANRPGPQLRILCAGDSITAGTFSDLDGGDGNGYRLRLRDDLSADRVIFTGTEAAPNGTMNDGVFAAWPGKTIKFITDNIGPSLKQRPNLVLLHAGTNDMNPNPAISTEGNDPTEAAKRLGVLVDRIVDACPDAVVLVAMIIPTCDQAQAPATREFQRQIPDMVRQRSGVGKRVLATNITSFPTDQLRDCIHPTNDGYRLLGDYWSDFAAQVPDDWLHDPVQVSLDEASPSSSLGAPWPSVWRVAAAIMVGSGIMTVM